MSNASKYSAEGKEILLDLTIVDKGVEVNIIDEGIGIPEKEQANLFSSRFLGQVT